MSAQPDRAGLVRLDRVVAYRQGPVGGFLLDPVVVYRLGRVVDSQPVRVVACQRDPEVDAQPALVKIQIRGTVLTPIVK